MYPTFIAAITSLAAMLNIGENDIFFGIEEITPQEGHGTAHLIIVEAGPSWVIYRPKKVGYWIVCDADAYPLL